MRREPGQVYSRPDGARLRIDHVANGQVYFVSWTAEQEYGAPKRMNFDVFETALELEKMRLETTEKGQPKTDKP